nr:MAG TPA: hypothetical protein [Bacteriophage sp.]DAT50640.1 MAG TPA: hypothetical protein [Bacteriophage sp.]
MRRQKIQKIAKIFIKGRAIPLQNFPIVIM